MSVIIFIEIVKKKVLDKNKTSVYYVMIIPTESDIIYQDLESE